MKGGGKGTPVKGGDNAAHVLLSRGKLDSISNRLQSEAGFAGYLLSAAHVSPDQHAAARRKGTGKPGKELAHQSEGEEEPFNAERQERGAAHAEPRAEGKKGLDITTDEISGSLLYWRAPSRMYLWGRGGEGQLGCGTVSAQAAVSRVVCPMQVSTGDGSPTGGAEGGGGAAEPSGSAGYVDTVPIRVACGRRVTTVVDNKRRLWAMGEGYFGRGKRERCHVPTLVSGLEKHAVVEVAIGKGFMLACTLEGVALVWGENEGMANLEANADKGYRRDMNFLREDAESERREKGKGSPGKAAPLQTGDGFMTAGTAQGHPLGFEPGSPYKVPAPRPISALGKEQVIAVAAGEAHLVALCASGRVYTWGGGSSGATGQGSTQPTWTPTALQLRTPAARSHGGKHASSSSSSPDASSGSPHSASAVAKSFSALSSRERRRSIAAVDGAQVAGTLGLGRVVKVSGGGAKREQGGEGGSVAGTQAEEAKYACAIGAGSHHTAVLARDGTVHVMGFAESGRLGLGHDRPEPVVHPTPLRVPGVTFFTAMACGGSHTLLVSADGRVFGCGDNSFGQCGVNTRDQRSSVFERLAGGGEVVHAERRILFPRQIFTPVFGDVVVVKVVAGMRHSACVDLSGGMWTWGLNEEGSCGSGDEVTSPEPVRVARFREVRVIQASMGDAHSGGIVMRSRAVPTSHLVSLLDDEDATGAAMTLEPVLPLNLRRERRQQLNVRRKAIAFCFARKRRLAKLARKRLLRRMLSQHMVKASDAGYTEALAAVAEATATENSVNVVTSPKLDPDSAEYGKNSAASVIQGLFRRWMEEEEEARYGGEGGHPGARRDGSTHGGAGGGTRDGEAAQEEYHAAPAPRVAKSSAVAALSKLQSMRASVPSSSSAAPAPAAHAPPLRGVDLSRQQDLSRALERMGFSSETLTDTV